MSKADSKHTPGPWFAETSNDGAWLIHVAGSVLCQRTQWSHRADESTANAHLIAAVPDLLSGLKAAVETIEKHVPADALGTDSMGDDSVPGGTMSWNVIDEHLHYMRKAIAKAEGRAQ